MNFHMRGTVERVQGFLWHTSGQNTKVSSTGDVEADWASTSGGRKDVVAPYNQTVRVVAKVALFLLQLGMIH